MRRQEQGPPKNETGRRPVLPLARSHFILPFSVAPAVCLRLAAGFVIARLIMKSPQYPGVLIVKNRSTPAVAFALVLGLSICRFSAADTPSARADGVRSG